MTVRQLYLFGCLYLVMLIATAVFTRATLRRIAGALAGAAVVGPAALGIVAAGEHAGWWHMAIIWEPYFLALLWANLVLCAYALLITWRIARRFGGRGLAVVALAGAILGPPRDYWYMRHFPEWGSYGPGHYMLENIPLPKEPRRLPTVLSQGEVAALIESASNLSIVPS